MKALAGIFLFITLSILCTVFAKPLYKSQIEADLGEKVRGILLKHDLDPSAVKIENHHLVHLGAQIPNRSAGEELRRELEGVIGLYLGNDLISPLILKPPHFHLAEQSDQTLVLKGLVRDESEREFLLSLVGSSAQQEGVPKQVEDLLRLSGNVARIPGRKELSAFTPVFLAAAERGNLSWSPMEFQMSGLLDNEEQREKLLSLSAEVFAGRVEPTNELVVQPLQDLNFGVERNRQRIIVSGLLPDKETQEHLLKLTRRESRGAYLIDKTSLAVRPHQSWWAGSPEKLFPAILSTTRGQARIHYYRDRFIAEATFDERADYDVVQDLLMGFPQQVQRSVNLRVVRKATAAPSVRRNNEFKAEVLILRLRNLAVYFDSSSAVIKESERGKIVEAAQIILESRDVTQGLTVGGYADLRGNASYNRSLSLRRAKAVRSQLIAEGVPEERLSVQHFGEDSSRRAKKDLWKSRRVEISLTQETDKEEE